MKLQKYKLLDIVKFRFNSTLSNLYGIDLVDFERDGGCDPNQTGTIVGVDIINGFETYYIHFAGKYVIGVDVKAIDCVVKEISPRREDFCELCKIKEKLNDIDDLCRECSLRIDNSSYIDQIYLGDIVKYKGEKCMIYGEYLKAIKPKLYLLLGNLANLSSYMKFKCRNYIIVIGGLGQFVDHTRNYLIRPYDEKKSELKFNLSSLEYYDIPERSEIFPIVEGKRKEEPKRKTCSTYVKDLCKVCPFEDTEECLDCNVPLYS